MSRGDRIRQRALAAAGADELDAMERRVESLEDAVAENDRLAGPLGELVGDLERVVAGILERSGARVRP